jgi:hypothetical protein
MSIGDFEAVDIRNGTMRQHSAFLKKTDFFNRKKPEMKGEGKLTSPVSATFCLHSRRKLVITGDQLS